MPSSKARPPDNPFDAALRLLAAREHSRKQLETKLLKRGYAPEDVAAALTKLGQLAYLDDSRFARALAREFMGRRMRGEGYVLAKLRGAGISEAVAQNAVAEARGEIDGPAQCRALAEKKLVSLREADPKRRRDKLARFLSGRGFAADMVWDTVDDLLRPDGNKED
ncbi:MAG: regulatory protein RecX [Myxococcales bacterium]|nr:MAG: regulatory protein RecX [Myxococcales bacterium]